MLAVKRVIPFLLVFMLFMSVFVVIELKASKIKPMDEDDNHDDNGGDDNNGGHEEEHEEDHEEVHYEEDVDEIHIRSNDNEIEFKKDKPEFEYQYYFANTNDQEAEIELEYRSKKLVEFIDYDNDSAIDDDEIIYELDLGNLRWTINTTVTYVPNSTAISSLTIKYIYNDSNVHIVIVFYISSNTSIVDGGADEIKVELMIYRWTWHADESLIGLESKLEASIESENYHGLANATLSADEVAVVIDVNNSAFVKFAFNKTVVVDGVEKDVVSYYWKHYEYENETEENEIEMEVEINSVVIFPRFQNNLYYDPKVGVEDDPTDVTQLAKLFPENGTGILNHYMIIAGIVAGLIILGLAAIFRKRKE